MVLEAGHAGTCYIIRSSIGRPVTKVHVTMGVRQGSVEGHYVSFFCMPSASRKPRKIPQHQRVIAVVPRGNPVSRLDLSDLCIVDDLVSLLIVWRKSQLSRFAEMVSQVLESARLRVNRSQTGGTGWSGRTRRTSHQCRECPWSIPVHIPRARQFELPQLLSTSGVRWSLREARAQRHR